MEPGKKLRRGLGDISSLFRSEPGATSPPSKVERSGIKGFHAFSIYSGLESSAWGEVSGEILSYAALRYQKAVGFHFSSSVSYENGFAGLDAGEWQKHMSKESMPSDKEIDDLSVFLDISSADWDLRASALQKSDGLIIVLDDRLDSLIESYRIIKFAAFQLSSMPFYTLFCSADPDISSGLLFEKWSLLLSKHLKVNTAWLGTTRNLRGQSSSAEFSVMYRAASSRRALKSCSLQKFIATRIPAS